MAEIKCPMCGKPNPPDLDVCQFCEARLKPLTDELSRSQPPIHPGDEPTPMDTGELEPVLPQWLRNVRQQSRDSAADDQEQAPAEEEISQPEEPADLLAGLQAQGDDDEEIPDWLTSLRGDSGDQPAPTASDDDDMAALKSMFGDESPAAQEQPAASDSDLGWAADFTADSAPEQESAAPEADNDLDWLSSLGESSDDEVSPQQELAPPAGDGGAPDWLASLGSESAENSFQDEVVQPPSGDDETADWLASLGTESTDPMPQSGELAQPTADGDMPDWLSSLGDESTQEVPPQEPSQAAEGDAPDWLSSLGAESAETSFQDEPVQPVIGDDDTPDWLASLESESTIDAVPQSEPAQPVADGDMPDWLSSLGEESAQETPLQEPVQAAAESDDDWLVSLGTESAETSFQNEAAQPATGDDGSPDWLASLESESTIDAVPQSEPAQPVADGDMPDWLSSFGEESAQEAPLQEPVQAAAKGDDDWLASLGAESAETPLQDEMVQPVAGDDDTPDWLASLGAEGTEEAPQDEPVQPALEGDLPDWLSPAGEEGPSVQADEVAAPPAFVEDRGQSVGASEDESPDWLASLGGEPAGVKEIDDQAAMPAFATETTDEFGEEDARRSAFVDDEGEPLLTDDVDALLSAETPDWLSDVDEQTDGDSDAFGLGAQPDELRPADLPSWVQAMRPVESVVSDTDGEGRDQAVEERGPLAGLRGVLPAAQGVGPSSKPKTYSLKLQASNEQQSSAVMLEQMLGAEVHPKPIVTQPVVLSQRVLRWLIAFLILLVVVGTVFTGTQVNLMPTSAPPETSAALHYVQNVPADSAVLLIFDYEAAQSGEMEAAAAPLVDHMLILKNPRLSMVSSTPTGTGLAERFIKIMQQDRGDYKRGERFTNLGYLPGGAAGILAFAENPVSVKSLSTDGVNAWNTPALKNVQQLSEFAAIILITSDAESARIWVEQTEQTRGETPFLVVSSAQSGPMILPYVQSGQVNGMVTGIDGSASIEQANSGRPGMVRRYWDAYGFGLLTAVAMIGVGSIWSLITGWQARRKEQGEG